MRELPKDASDFLGLIIERAKELEGKPAIENLQLAPETLDFYVNGILRKLFHQMMTQDETVPAGLNSLFMFGIWLGETGKARVTLPGRDH